MTYRLKYSDYITTASGPPDPAAWVGPPGPVGPQGPQGPQGQPQTGGPFLPISGGTASPGPVIVTAPSSGNVTIKPIGMFDVLPTSTSEAQLHCEFSLGQGRGGTYFNPFYSGRFINNVYGALDMSAGGLLGQVNYSGTGGVGQHCALQAYANRYTNNTQPTTTVAATLGAPANTIQIADVTSFQYDSQPILINGNSYLQIAHTGTSGAGTIAVERNIPVADGTAGHVVTGQNNPSLWAFNINVNDNANGQNITSSRLSNYTIGCELDFGCSGLDDSGPLLFGSPAGVRNMIGCVGFGGTPANPAEIGDGVSIGAGAGSTISWKRGFRMAGTFSQAVFDTRQAVAQGGGAHAVWLADGHTIAFDTAGTRTLSYDGASGKMFLAVSGVNKLSIDANGNVRAAGTITGSTTP